MKGFADRIEVKKIGEFEKALLVQLRGDAKDVVAAIDKEQKLEFLAAGQQFIAHGEHPKTGKPYTWFGCGDIVEIEHDELPEITEAEARQRAEAEVAQLHEELRRLRSRP